MTPKTQPAPQPTAPAAGSSVVLSVLAGVHAVLHALAKQSLPELRGEVFLEPTLQFPPEIGAAPDAPRLGPAAIAGDVKAIGVVGDKGGGGEVDGGKAGGLGPGEAAVGG